MAGLPRQHREPSDEPGESRVLEQQRITDKKDHRADQVKRLVDPVLMVVPVIVKALRSQRLGKVAHSKLHASLHEVTRNSIG